MYLLYAPPKKFNVLPYGYFFISSKTKFYNNVAYCLTQHAYKQHLLRGLVDITPPLMVKLRSKRIFNKIVLFAKGGFGDSMWLMPFAKEFRRLNPSCKITVLTDPKNLALWQGVYYVDFAIADSYDNISNAIVQADEVFDFSGIATVYENTVKLDPIEAIFKMSGLALPKIKKDCRPELCLNVEEGLKAEATLKAGGIDPDVDKYIVIATESSTKNRDWPFLYTKYLTKLLKEKGFKIVWLSSNQARKDTTTITCDCGWEAIISTKTILSNLVITCPNCKTKKTIEINKDDCPTLDLTGKTSIRDCMAILSLSDCFVGPNSGLMVMATALDIPTVGLFGAFDPRTRTKFYERFSFVWGKIKCAPCNEHWHECDKGFIAPCMKSISPQQVLDAVLILVHTYPKNVLARKPLI